MYARALETLDYDFLSYGRRSAPHDVPPTTSTPTPLPVPAAKSDDLPTGFIPSGGPLDRYILRLHRFRHSPALAQLSYTNLRAITPNNFPSDAIPAYPPLPTVRASRSRPRFVRTGDPMVDELRLSEYVQRHGTQAERNAVDEYARLHTACIAERKRLSDEQRGRALGNVKLLLAHLSAAEDVFVLAAGDTPMARLEAQGVKHVYAQCSASLLPLS